jgi:DNA-binding GntR family transcriptional regulator
LNLELPPGSQMTIENLAEQLGTSRTPIREALLRLESESLIRGVPRVGYFVAEITRRDLEEVFELRALLESYAAKRAAPVLTDSELAHIDELLESGCAAVDKGNLREFLDFEAALHAAITSHAQNSHLSRMMASLADLIYRERIMSIEVLENVQASCVEHGKLVQALHERNPEKAGTLMWDHIWAVRERMLQYVDSLSANENSAS